MANPRRTRRVEGDIEVAVVRVGGRLQRVMLPAGSSVDEAIEEAGFTVKPHDEVAVNGESTSNLNQKVEDADRITITPRFEGGVNYKK